jgi:hypothetical protein
LVRTPDLDGYRYQKFVQICLCNDMLHDTVCLCTSPDYDMFHDRLVH